MSIRKIVDPILGVAGVLALAVSASITTANTEVHEKIKLKVKTDDGVAETVNIENLEVGGGDFFVTESGKEIFVSRTEGGFALEIDGKVIDVPVPKHHGKRVWIEKDGEGGDHDVFVHKEHGDGQVHKRRMMVVGDGEKVHAHGDSNEFVFISDDGDVTHGEGVMIRKKVLIDDGSGEQIIEIDDCDIDVHTMDADDEDVLIECLGGDADVDVDVMVDGDGGTEKHIVIIKKHVESDDQ
ncbi:MAG: hypothetical protein DHS20C11_09290 [Lysobacteraceae bacterium]|nr:MAG: hypothetical protein DHS20C11_09290 [Xanthomonadaceae bacterium]